MASVNKVILMGHLGRDPDTRYGPNGEAITNISLATSESWKDKDSGEKVEKTEWHRVIFFKRQAEVAGEYLKKGSPVYIEGSLRTRKWTDKEGVERYTTEIHARELKLMGSKPDSTERAGGSPSEGSPPAEPKPAEKKPAGKRGSFDDLDDDIPF